MKLQQLAADTGTPVSTVKYYLREGLLPPGRKLNTTTAAYGQHHVERLRLIGALRQVVGLGLSGVRQVVDAVETLEPVPMMGRVQAVVMSGFPTPAGPDSADGTSQRLTARQIMDRMGWLAGSPESVEALDHHLATMDHWGVAPDLEGSLVYARAADDVAAEELTRRAPWVGGASGPGDRPPSNDVIATYTAVGIHAYSQLLMRLHAVAQGSYARRLESE